MHLLCLAMLEGLCRYLEKSMEVITFGKFFELMLCLNHSVINEGKQILALDVTKTATAITTVNKQIILRKWKVTKAQADKKFIYAKL